MPAFPPQVLEAARNTREVTLTTLGRKTAKPRRVVVWISTDGKHLYVRSGGGLRRDWPQNLLARGEGALQLAGLKVEVKSRLITDPVEARSVAELHRAKYGSQVRPSRPPDPLTPGEKATFELFPTG